VTRGLLKKEEIKSAYWKKKGKYKKRNNQKIEGEEDSSTSP